MAARRGRVASWHRFLKSLTVLLCDDPETSLPLVLQFDTDNCAPAGQRTGLCSNVSLLRRMKKRMAPDYAAIERMVEAMYGRIPPAVRLRRTRCDDASSLSATSCPNKTMCQ
ncbi:unnamed protein product [Effrenium voratum]|nr:unnamed protein product [Effrenium voratum]